MGNTTPNNTLNNPIQKSESAAYIETEKPLEVNSKTLDNPIQNKESLAYLEIQKPPVLKSKRTVYKLRGKSSIGFERAEWEEAQKRTKQMSVLYFEDSKVNLETQLDHFRIYGSGIYLFFYFCKKVIFLFVILTALSLIPTVYNAVVGESYATIQNSLSKYLGIISIGNLRPYDQKYTSMTDKLMNSIPTFFISLVFFAFYLYWSKKSEEQIRQLRNTIKMDCYNTVEVIKFPKDITEVQLFYYMSQYGQVKEISPVRDYNEMIFYCRKIYEQTLDGKEILLEREKKQIETDDQLQKQIQQRQKKLQDLYVKLQREEKDSSKETIKFFVTFQSPQERQKAVETFQPYLQSKLSCFKKVYPEQLKAKGEQILVKACHTEPAGIIWQNMHVTWKTRWIRLLLQLLLIAIMIFLGFCFILILNVLNPPITTSHIDSSAYNSTSIMAVQDQSIVRSWCLNNYDLVQQWPDSDFGLLCDKYLASTASRVLISIAIGLGVMLIKYILKYTVLYLSKFMRYKTYSQQAVEMTKNLSITYFFSTVFITVFMQAKFGNFTPKELVREISSSQNILMNLKEMNSFQDTYSGWYLDVGYQIWITWFILAITYPILIFTYHYPLKKLCKFLAERQILQRKMEQYLMPEQFQIYDHYANLAIFIFVGFVLSPGMPSLIILTGFGLILRYVYFKFVFIRFSKIPKPLDESLNTILLIVLVCALFFHLIMAIWMYGVDELFDHSDSFLHNQLYSDDDSDFTKFWLILIKRCVDSWYLTALLVFYTFYFFLWGFLRDIYNRCTGKTQIIKASPQMLKDTVGNGGYVIGIGSERSLTKSYKIQNNPDYFDILAIIQRRQLVSTIVPPKNQS